MGSILSFYKGHLIASTMLIVELECIECDIFEHFSTIALLL